MTPRDRLDRICAHYAVSPKTSGSTYIKCPAHGGGDRNLALWVDDALYRIGACCHSQGCSYKAIAEAIERDCGVSIGTPKDRRTEWHYGNGKTVRRTDRGDGSKKMDQSRGAVKGTPLLLLPADGPDPVVLCEGEKAAEAIKAAGLTGACWIGGAGQAHLADYSAVKDRNVVIWPDDDEAGRNAATVAHRHLIAAGVKTVRYASGPQDSGDSRKDAADYPPETVRERVGHAECRPDPEPNPKARGRGRPKSGEKERVEAHSTEFRALGFQMGAGEFPVPLSNSIYNVVSALNMLGYEDRYRRNQWTGNIERDGETIKRIDDSEVYVVKMDLEFGLMQRKVSQAGLSYSPTLEAVRGGLEISAQRLAYDPWVDRLRSAEWDDVKRLDAWLGEKVFKQRGELNCLIAALLVRGTVLRALKPGSTFPYIPVMVSRYQGVGKGKSLKRISGGYHVDGIAVDSYNWKKDLQDLFQGCAIAEISEIDGLSGSRLSNAKTLATIDVLQNRLSYGRIKTSMDMRTIIVGTSNNLSFLSDTEHRRNPVIRIPDGEVIDLALLEQSMPQLWAEAVAEVDSGMYDTPDDPVSPAMLTLPPRLWADANAASEAYRLETQVQVYLEDKLGRHTTDFIPSADLHSAMRAAGLNWSNNEFGAVMARLGWIKQRRKTDGRKVSGWQNVGFHPANCDDPDCLRCNG